MQPLNFLRQATDYVTKHELPYYKKNYPKDAKCIKEILSTAFTSSEKFILPNLGKILDDDLKAVPDYLQLPFKSIVLEYTAINDGALEDVGLIEDTPAPKRVIIAFQRTEDIVLYSIAYCHRADGSKGWTFSPFSAIIPNDAIRRSNGDVEFIFKASAITDGVMIKTLYGDTLEEVAYKDLSKEVFILLGFLEALSCSNVGYSERVSSTIPSASLKKAKNPFDSYRTLVINVSRKPEVGDPSTMINERASPREHVRRGHVRHYSSGLKIWINNTIVSAGSGGRIEKTYVIKP